jgi:hypothetical protein
MKVYEDCLSWLIAPVVGSADDDDADPAFDIGDDDPQRNEKVRAIFDEKLLPSVHGWFPEFGNETKLALAYLLTFASDKAERVWDSVLPLGSTTDPPILLWEWFWDELFPGEDYHLREGDYEVVTVTPNLAELRANPQDVSHCFVNSSPSLDAQQPAIPPALEK